MSDTTSGPTADAAALAAMGVGPGATEDDDVANSELYKIFEQKERDKATGDSDAAGGGDASGGTDVGTPTSDAGQGTDSGAAGGPDAPGTPGGTTESDATTDDGVPGTSAGPPPQTPLPGTPPPDPGTPPPPLAPEAPPPATIEYAGQFIPPDRMDAMLALDSWASSLPPEAVTTINSVLEGQAVVVDRATAQRWADMEAGRSPAPIAQQSQPVVQSPVGQPQPAIQPGSPPAVDPFAGIDLDDLDPALVTALKAQQAQLAQTQAQLQQVSQQTTTWQQQQDQARVAQQQQELIGQVHQARDIWAAKYELDPALAESHLRRAGEAQILPPLMAKHRGDVAAAVDEALEYVAFTDPVFRAHVMDRQSTQDQQQRETQQVRATKASSLSGGGGSTSRPEPVDPTVDPETGQPKSRQVLMAEAIAASRNGSGQG